MNCVCSNARPKTDGRWSLLQKETNYKMWSTKFIAPPPTAQTTSAIESIFWLEVHQANINGATTAFLNFHLRPKILNIC